MKIKIHIIVLMGLYTIIAMLFHLHLSNKTGMKKNLKICVLHPNNLLDASEMHASMQRGTIYIVDLTNSEVIGVQRIVDYILGLADATDYKVELVLDRVLIVLQKDIDFHIQ